MRSPADFLNTDGEHEHDSSVSSVSITETSYLLDLALVEDWITELLRTKGTDIYRMKGVLNIAHGARVSCRAHHQFPFPRMLSLAHRLTLQPHIFVAFPCGKRCTPCMFTCRSGPARP